MYIVYTRRYHKELIRAGLFISLNPDTHLMFMMVDVVNYVNLLSQDIISVYALRV